MPARHFVLNLADDPIYRVALFGAAVVVVFDVAASLASKATGFDYENFFWVSLAIYAAGGFLAARRGATRRETAGVGALIAAGEASVGWLVSYLIEPDFYGYTDGPSAGLIVFVFVGTVLFGALMGLVGGVVARRFGIESLE